VEIDHVECHALSFEILLRMHTTFLVNILCFIVVYPTVAQ